MAAHGSWWCRGGALRLTRPISAVVFLLRGAVRTGHCRQARVALGAATGQMDAVVPCRRSQRRVNHQRADHPAGEQRTSGVQCSSLSISMVGICNPVPFGFAAPNSRVPADGWTAPVAVSSTALQLSARLRSTDPPFECVFYKLLRPRTSAQAMERFCAPANG